MSEVAKLVTTQSDQELAALYKRDIGALLLSACALLDSAAAQGLIINFAIGKDVGNRNVVGSLTVAKYL